MARTKAIARKSTTAKKKKAPTPQAPASKSKKGAAGAMEGTTLTAITTNVSPDVLYRSGLELHFEEAEPAFKIVAKAGSDNTVPRSKVENDFHWEEEGEEKWLTTMLKESKAADDDAEEPAAGSSSGNLVKLVLETPLVVESAELIGGERSFIKPHVSARGEGKTKEAKILRLTFEGHDGVVDFFVNKAAYSHPEKDDPEGFEEYIVPVDLQISKKAA